MILQYSSFDLSSKYSSNNDINTLQIAVLPLEEHSAFVPQGPVEQGSTSQPRL